MQLPGGHLSHVLSAGCRAFGSSLLDTLFPPRCVGCGDFETFLCADCRTQMEVLEPGVCCRCGRPLTDCEPEECPDCGDWEPAFAAVRSAFLHTGAARTLVAGLKYGGQRALAPILEACNQCASGACVEESAPDRSESRLPVPAIRTLFRFAICERPATSATNTRLQHLHLCSAVRAQEGLKSPQPTQRGGNKVSSREEPKARQPALRT